MNKVEPVQTVELVGELTIFRSMELKELLLTVAECGGSVALNLGAVSEVDTAGIQLLLSLKHSIEAGGGVVQIASASPAIHEALHLLGMSQAFAA